MQTNQRNTTEVTIMMMAEENQDYSQYIVSQQRQHLEEDDDHDDGTDDNDDDDSMKETHKMEMEMMGRDGYEEADRSGGANLTVLKFKRKVIAETNSAKKIKISKLAMERIIFVDIYLCMREIQGTSQSSKYEE